MPRAARVLIVGAISSRAAETAQVLSARGYSTILSDPDDAVAELLSSRRPDVVLFDRRGASADGRSATSLSDFADAVRESVLWQDLPFLILDEDDDEEFSSDALLLIDRLGQDAVDAELDHRISALSRLCTMRAELARRLRTVQKLGKEADTRVAPPGFVENPHVLVAGVGYGLPKVQSALGDEATVFGVPTANLALDHLENFSVDLVVVDATEDASRALDMVSALRRMPRWSALPIVVTAPATITVADRKLIHDYGATDIITQDESDGFSANRITVLIREHRFSVAIQAAFREISQDWLDSNTRLIGRDFGLVHLMELLRDCDRQGDGFSAVGIKIDPRGAAASFAGSIGGALSSIIRGEDLAISLAPDLFCIMLPGTDGPQARTVRDRISAVIGSTDFGFDDMGLPRIAPVSYAATEYKPGDNPETFMARLLEGFSLTERPVDRITGDELAGG